MDRPKKSSWRKRLSSSGVDEDLISVCSGLLLACDLCGVFCLPFPLLASALTCGIIQPFYPMSHLSRETMSPQKRRLTKAVAGTDLGWGQWSRSESWLCPLLHGLPCRVNCPCLLLPDGSAGGGAFGHCDSISVSMSGTSTVGQMRCVTTFAFPCSYWGQHLAFTSVLFGSRWILFRIQKLHEGWKKPLQG